jgi:hypothetical protein
MQKRANNNNYRRFVSAIFFSFTLNNEPMLKTRDIELRKILELICILARIQYPQKNKILAGIFNNNTGLFTRGVLLNFYFAATNNTMAVTTKSNVLFLLN